MFKRSSSCENKASPCHAPPASLNFFSRNTQRRFRRNKQEKKVRTKNLAFSVIIFPDERPLANVLWIYMHPTFGRGRGLLLNAGAERIQFIQHGRLENTSFTPRPQQLHQRFSGKRNVNRRAENIRFVQKSQQPYFVASSRESLNVSMYNRLELGAKRAGHSPFRFFKIESIRYSRGTLLSGSVYQNIDTSELQLVASVVCLLFLPFGVESSPAPRSLRCTGCFRQQSWSVYGIQISRRVLQNMSSE